MESSRIPFVSRYWALGLFALVVASYRIWTPTLWSVDGMFPPVPVADFPDAMHFAYSWIAVPTLAIGCLLASGFLTHSRIQLGWVLVGFTLTVGAVLDQHRLQPWVYQALLYSAWMALLPGRLVIRFMQILTISIYFYSSIGKFDYQFVHTVGQDFLATIGRLVGLDISAWDDATRSRVVLAFPLAELATAVLLIIPRTRRFGAYFAMAMHVGLIVLLSPLGMNHSLGVLAWNAVLAGQAYLLFVKLVVPAESPPPPDESSPNESHHTPNPKSNSWRSVVAVLLLGLALVLPLSERRDHIDDTALHWDHWLSWALYSPHNSRFKLEVHRSLVSDFPDSWSGAVGEDTDADGWHPLDLGQLALDIRGVPLVPQARYQLGLALAIAESHDTPGIESLVRGVVRSSSGRRDGNRRQQWLMNLDAMRKRAKGFWLLENQ